MVHNEMSEKNVRAWVLFFVALHDLGKFDVRFQLKASDVAIALWPEFEKADKSQSNTYWHGDYCAYWARNDLDARFNWSDDFGNEEKWEQWRPWLFAISGHHGVIPTDTYGLRSPRADQLVIQQDYQARMAFISEMESMFLHPVGLSLEDNPPACDLDFFAGFCSICDWLGSTELNKAGLQRFVYKSNPMVLGEYSQSRLSIAELVFEESGLFKPTVTKGGMASLFPGKTPRSVQTLVDKIPLKAGLTIIEAPTGSGKTEAALAYGSRLLKAGFAESIIFALPTQATANAMFERLTDFTETMFGNANFLLAHGKAEFNQQFLDLKNVASNRTPQDASNETEAQLQCSQWLSQSRKRVFLGQVGVCTIDQVLISVLPVKHKFVRAFGLGKSVLIVDEVHAYDSYMYGLLQEVLRRQYQMQGSAILLSATLPSHQKNSLVHAWDENGGEQELHASYPLILHRSGTANTSLALEKSEVKNQNAFDRIVQIDIAERAEMHFDEDLLKQVINAAEDGANVAIICNLVADAQATAKKITDMGAKPVVLFHSRFRYGDRQQKEKNVLKDYGNRETRKHGGILVATQVVEQSLDLDFDWMLTQLCPMDLVFQRMGRLHRHDRERPNGFESPRCTVVVPINHDYALHKVIYGSGDAPNARVLWRTEQLLRQNNTLRFPEVYRPLIEMVYQQDPWEDEPEAIREEYSRFEMTQQAVHATAWQLAHSKPNFEDSDSRISMLTRDGEMSLNVIPVFNYKGKRTLLDGSPVANIDEIQIKEVLSLNTVPVPASWKRSLPQEEDGLVWLPMTQQADGEWLYGSGNTQLTYSMENGLERKQL